jgi:hypothetical protein
VDSKFTATVFGDKADGFPTIVIDTRGVVADTRYSPRYNKITQPNGLEYNPLLIIQCGSRTSREEGLALAERICTALNKEIADGK